MESVHVVARVERCAFMQGVHGGELVPVEQNHGLVAFDLHSRVGFFPFMMVPHCGHHFRFDFSHLLVR